jgi:hypothetical protein
MDEDDGATVTRALLLYEEPPAFALNEASAGWSELRGSTGSRSAAATRKPANGATTRTVESTGTAIAAILKKERGLFRGGIYGDAFNSAWLPREAKTRTASASVQAEKKAYCTARSVMSTSTASRSVDRPISGWRADV